MKIWAFSDFFNQVKSDIENFKRLFQIEDDGGIGEHAPVYSLLLWIKNNQIAKPLCYSVWF